MKDSNLITSWNYLDKGHCAFKSSSGRNKIRCNHLFTLTGVHTLNDCPLVQPKYISFQQQEGIVYLIEKNPDAAPSSMWGFTELPVDREKAKKVVEKVLKSINKDLHASVWRKFEQRFDVAKIIQTSKELEEEEDS